MTSSPDFLPQLTDSRANRSVVSHVDRDGALQSVRPLHDHASVQVPRFEVHSMAVLSQLSGELEANASRGSSDQGRISIGVLGHRLPTVPVADDPQAGRMDGRRQVGAAPASSTADAVPLVVSKQDGAMRRLSIERSHCLVWTL
jgi:hypothetical protein